MIDETKAVIARVGGGVNVFQMKKNIILEPWNLEFNTEDTKPVKEWQGYFLCVFCELCGEKR